MDPALRLRTHLALDLALDLDSFDPAMFESPRRRLAEQGLRVTTLAAEQATRADALDRAYALHNECRRRQPPVETRLEPIPRPDWVEAFLEGEKALPDAYFIAAERERYLGVSVVVRVADQPAALTAGFTGVLPDYSGRGIGLGLKIETILYARAHGYSEIRTGLLDENLAMLRINEKLGFRVMRRELKQYRY